MNPSRKTKNPVWTLKPPPDVRSLVSKEITKRGGRGAKGLRSQIIFNAIRRQYAHLVGKLELKGGGRLGDNQGDLRGGGRVSDNEDLR